MKKRRAFPVREIRRHEMRAVPTGQGDLFRRQSRNLIAVCKHCGMREGELTAECPGALTIAEAIEGLDFIGGQWVRRRADLD